MASKTYFFTFLIITINFNQLIKTNPEESQTAIITNNNLKLCSGVLVDTRFVLTAAKCLDKVFEVAVVFNTDNLLKNSSLAYISSTFIHNNTIALIKLPDTPKLTNFKGLDLPDGPLSNGQLKLLGWCNQKGSTFGQMSSNDVTVIKKYSNEFCSLNEKLFCATLDNPNQNWNVGSPMISNDSKVVGITVDNQDSVILASDISAYTEWIKNKIN